MVSRARGWGGGSVEEGELAREGLEGRWRVVPGDDAGEEGAVDVVVLVVQDRFGVDEAKPLDDPGRAAECGGGVDAVEGVARPPLHGPGRGRDAEFYLVAQAAVVGGDPHQGQVRPLAAELEEEYSHEGSITGISGVSSPRFFHLIDYG